MKKYKRIYIDMFIEGDLYSIIEKIDKKYPNYKIVYYDGRFKFILEKEC